jgi:hypothetical protein
MPEREDAVETELWRPGELEAKLASSRESRACGWRLAYVGMVVAAPFLLPCPGGWELVGYISRAEGGEERSSGLPEIVNHVMRDRLESSNRKSNSPNLFL